MFCRLKSSLFESFLILFLILNSTLSAFAQKTIDGTLQKYNTGSIPYIQIDELRSKLASNNTLILLDTRSKEEYEVSHLKNAIWIGYKKFNNSNLPQIDKDAEIVLYCSVGVRSERIGEELRTLGFKNLANLYGGIFLWVNQQNPIYKDGKQTNEIHTYNKKWESFITYGKKIN